MFSVNKSKILGLICILSASHIQSGIIRVDTVYTADDKRVTFLADDHGKNETYKEQTNELFRFLQQREKANEPTQIFFEQTGSWLTDNIFRFDDHVLPYLTQRIKKIHTNPTLTSYENVEVRHIANAAHDALLCPCEFYKNWPIEYTQKTMDTLTFQDLLDEFARLKQVNADYFHQDTTMTTIYNKCLQEANTYHEKILQIINTNDISLHTPIFTYAENNPLENRKLLGEYVFHSFAEFFDLHTIRTILTSPHKNIIIVAGARHTSRIKSALANLNSTALYPTGINAIIENEMLVSIDEIQKGLSMQTTQTLPISISIKKYAPTTIIFFITCFLLYTTITQTMIQ